MVVTFQDELAFPTFYQQFLNIFACSVLFKFCSFLARKPYCPSLLGKLMWWPLQEIDRFIGTLIQ